MCDDPFDPHREVGIELQGTGIFIPFEMQGTTVLFNTRVPTMNEIRKCRTVVLASDTQWNPQDVKLQRKPKIGPMSANNISTITEIHQFDEVLGCFRSDD